MNPDDNNAGFLARWSRRKAQVRAGTTDEAAAPPLANPDTATRDKPEGRSVTPATPATLATPPAPAAPTQPPTPTAPTAPTLADVESLHPQSDFSRFVGRDVDPAVRHAALKKLFADPHFNVMDGMDVYIDDYGLPDPLPRTMLKQMAQSAWLGLTDEPARSDTACGDAGDATNPDRTLPCENAAHEDADLRLQPDDATGPASADPGPVTGPGCQH